MQLYNRYVKLYSALLIQLRTSKIDFNQFLHKRQVFNIVTMTYKCDIDCMSIKHILLIYSRQKKKQKIIQQKKNTIDIKKLLGAASATIAILRIILLTDLLNQFQITEISEKKKTNRQRDYKFIEFLYRKHLQQIVQDTKLKTKKEDAAYTQCLK